MHFVHKAPRRLLGTTSSTTTTTTTTTTTNHPPFRAPPRHAGQHGAREAEVERHDADLCEHKFWEIKDVVFEDVVFDNNRLYLRFNYYYYYFTRFTMIIRIYSYYYQTPHPQTPHP